jgi:hypothetical protein
MADHFIVNISENHANLYAVKGTEAFIIEYATTKEKSRFTNEDSIITINNVGGKYIFNHTADIVQEAIITPINEREVKAFLRSYNSDKQYYKHVVPIIIRKTFNDDNYLDNYKFSLKAIENYNLPDKPRSRGFAIRVFKNLITTVIKPITLNYL